MNADVVFDYTDLISFMWMNVWMMLKPRRSFISESRVKLSVVGWKFIVMG